MNIFANIFKLIFMILLTISFGKILFSGIAIFMIAMAVTPKGNRACDHTWQLTGTTRIPRKHGERALTTYSYKCSKCGRTKTTVS